MELSGFDQTGFMSWEELALANNMGVLDVQSHSQTHTWYFSGPKIVDCFLPHNAANYPWMPWNARPERKPFYLEEDQSEFVRWGTPILEFEKSLIVKRFFPEKEIVQKVVDATNEIESICRTSRPIELSRYKQLVRRLVGDDEIPGVFETAQEYESRVSLELATSKQMIEDKLNKVVEFLCWPGGGVNNDCRRIAAEVGYKSWTLPSNEQQGKRNRPGEDPLEIKRLTAMRDVHMLGRRWGRGTDTLLFLDILAHQQSVASNFLRRLYKVGVAFGIVGER